MADGLDLPEIVKRTIQANAKLYKGWVDLSLDYWKGIAEIFGGGPVGTPAPTQEMDAGGGALVLEGEEGVAARGAFLVTNDLGRVISCEFVASDFADPSGARVAAKPSFEPATLELGPGEQKVVQVMIPIDGSLIAGVGYVGEVAIKGMDGFSVPVVLRRQHRVEEKPADDVEPGRDPIADETPAPPGPPPPKDQAQTQTETASARTARVRKAAARKPATKARRRS